jgi:hypothetical protein
MADRIVLKFDDQEFERVMRALQRVDQDHEKELRQILRKAAKIAADKVNSSIYSGTIKRDTGGLSKAMGVGTFKSEAGGYIGGKARPKKASDSNAGWRIHFFAKPARQMTKQRPFDFQGKYDTVLPKIRSQFLNDLKKLIEKAIQ